ncbi:MAG: hypothetical protein ACR2HJ_01100 [Fimbriimonadales bacterium]
MLSNVALPTAFVIWPLMAIWFCALAFLGEAWIVAFVTRMRFRNAVPPVLLANLLSSLVGLPILFALPWLLMLPLESAMRSMGDPWKGVIGVMMMFSGSENPAHAFWGLQLLGFLCMFVSIAFEFVWLRRKLISEHRVLRATVVANLASYSVWFVYFGYAAS